MKKLMVCTLLLFMSLRHNTAKRTLMSVILQRCTSYGNPEYCKISTVCRPVNRTSKLISMDIYFNPGVMLNAPTYIEVVAFKKFTTVYRPFMIKLRSELCKELSLRSHPIFKLSKTPAACAGNLCDPCPLKGHRYRQRRITNAYEYVLDGIPILPAGEWRFDIKISLDRNGSELMVVSWSDYYEIKALTAEQF